MRRPGDNWVIRTADLNGPTKLCGLLATEEMPTGLLSRTSANSPSWSLGEGTPTVGGRPSVGRWRVGRYLLIERLGGGGQGDVWKAVQTDPVIEVVALKVLAPAWGLNPKRVAQFRREAERGARLSSPSILPTYEFGEADGVVFIAMPLVNGFSLNEVLNQRRQLLAGEPPVHLHRLAVLSAADYQRAMARVLVRIARALEDAHAAQVVHRDVKPSNILLDGSHADRVFLVDFGLGRDLDAVTPSQLRDGAGTPMFMAPEKLLGRQIDEVRCDVYSLGVTLFEALTLTPPLTIPDSLPRSAWAPYLAGLEPPRPRDLESTVPEPLEAIILRAMERNPARRYPSAADLAADLGRYLDEVSGRSRRRASG